MENLHPLIVHFPIALLITALALETVGLFWRAEILPRVALWNLGLGTLGAAAAVLTGRLAADEAKHSHEIFQVMAQHARLGYLVLWGAVAATGWRLATRGRADARSRWIGWGLLAAVCGTLAVGAHLGGRLVYEYGVGGSYGRAHGGIEVVNPTTQGGTAP